MDRARLPRRGVSRTRECAWARRAQSVGRGERHVKRKPMPPGVYVRLDAADLRHVERHMKRMQREAEGKITQSDAIRALVRAGVAADTLACMTGGASRGSPSDKKVVLTKRIMAAP